MENKDEGRLLDGFDGGSEPSPEYMKKLLAGAPAYIKARIAEREGEQKKKKPAGAAE